MTKSVTHHPTISPHPYLICRHNRECIIISQMQYWHLLYSFLAGLANGSHFLP